MQIDCIFLTFGDNTHPLKPDVILDENCILLTFLNNTSKYIGFNRLAKIVF